MRDDLFRDLPAEFVRQQVGHSYGSTTALYVALSREATGDNIGSDDA